MIGTETVSNNVGHFVIFANPNEWTGNHIRRSDEGYMRQVIDKFADGSKVALDVGSCFGLHGLYMSKKFKAVLAFEPQKIIASLSERTFFLNGIDNVRVFNMACSDTAEEVDFPSIGYEKTHNVGGLSAAYNEGPDANTNVGWDGESIISVQSDTIDAMLSDYLLDLSIGFIKIDVEGFEYRVLKGAEQMLKKFLCPLAIEIKDFPEGNRAKTHKLLIDIGYNNFQDIGNSGYDYLYTQV